MPIIGWSAIGNLLKPANDKFTMIWKIILGDDATRAPKFKRLLKSRWRPRFVIPAWLHSSGVEWMAGIQSDADFLDSRFRFAASE